MPIANPLVNEFLTIQPVRLLAESFFWLAGLRIKAGKIDLSQVKKILIVRLDGIGDVILSSPFLRELRRNFPKVWITLVVKPGVYSLVELCPYVNEVLTYDWDIQEPMRQLRQHVRALRLAREHLWKRKFDLAILPRWDIDYYNGGFLVYFSGAKWRLGYSENVAEGKRYLNRGFNRLFTTVLEGNGSKHEVERNLEILRRLGGTIKETRLEVWVGEEDDSFAERVLKSHGVQSDKLLAAFGVGAGAGRRVWPIQNFMKIGKWLNKELGARILCIGGQGEEILGRKIQDEIGKTVINMVGHTTLRQVAALFRACDIYVGNDAGPMHLAAAMGLPVIEISCHPENGMVMHPNSPKRFGPWGVPHIVIQPKALGKPCHEACRFDRPHCILNISVDEVKRAIEDQLSNRAFQWKSERPRAVMGVVS